MKQDLRVQGWNFNKIQDSSVVITTLIFLIALFGFVISMNFFTGLFLLIGIVLWGLVLYFFRDPDREIPKSPGIILSPGDGVVKDISKIQDNEQDHDRIQVGIFLSVFDVHVQRVPVSGKVKFITHQAGQYHPAFHPSASTENEQIIMGIDTEYGLVTVKQISGILARKCINFLSEGDQIQIGQRYGLIKFGSRVELVLPTTAKLICNIGDKVKGGLTSIAEIPLKED